MSPLVQKETRVYKRILMLLLTLAAVTVSGCLGLLWLRQQIEITAQATRLLEEEIVREERRLRYVDAKLAEIHQPVFLERQIARLGLDLAPPEADQIIYLGRPRSLAQSGPSEARPAGASRDRDPFRRSIDLAVMESLRPID
jgi:hypothetical protein